MEDMYPLCGNCVPTDVGRLTCISSKVARAIPCLSELGIVRSDRYLHACK